MSILLNSERLTDASSVWLWAGLAPKVGSWVSRIHRRDQEAWEYFYIPTWKQGTVKSAAGCNYKQCRLVTRRPTHRVMTLGSLKRLISCRDGNLLVWRREKKVFSKLDWINQQSWCKKCWKKHIDEHSSTLYDTFNETPFTAKGSKLFEIHISKSNNRQIVVVFLHNS